MRQNLGAFSFAFHHRGTSAPSLCHSLDPRQGRFTGGYGGNRRHSCVVPIARYSPQLLLSLSANPLARARRSRPTSWREHLRDQLGDSLRVDATNFIVARDDEGAGIPASFGVGQNASSAVRL